MATFLSLSEAIAEYVHDGQTVALEGFTHLIPHSAGHEIIRQRKRELTLVRMTPDIIYDQLVGAGCASHLIFSWGGNPGVGSLHRVRAALGDGSVSFEEHSHAGMAAAYRAGASALPFGMLRGYIGSDLRSVNDRIREVVCPFTGERLAAVPAIRPDVTIIHAQRADRQGNVQIEGIVGVQKEAVLAAKHSIVTVEEIVDELPRDRSNTTILPAWVIDAVVLSPGAAAPSYAYGYYERDNAFYLDWDAISRSPELFTAWLDEHVFDVGSSPAPKS